MGIIFDYTLTEGIAQLSYLIGDDAEGTAAIIDPRPDCKIYLKWARRHGVAITHVLDTHNHADYMSGARELAAKTGATIYLAPEPDQEYHFDFEAIRDGDRFAFGDTVLTARHTPGHTPMHMAFEAAVKEKSDPWCVFTGDSLFVASVGRPDLAGRTEELSRALYDTIYKYFLKLDDGVIIYPCHGKGSACGPHIGDRLQSTIGYERHANAFLQFKNVEDFVQSVKDSAPAEPTHYARLKKTNAVGPPVTGGRPVIRALPPKEFQEAVKSGEAVVVDCRSMLAFGGGHVPCAINIPGGGELSVYAGWMLDADKPMLLILDDETPLDDVLALFMRTGFVLFSGYLAGGMKAWNNTGLPLATTPQVSVHEVKAHGGDWQILDVRAPEEWEEGHIPGATHFFVADLPEGMPQLDRKQPVVTYCGTGYRASIAASMLQAEGFEDVRTVPGSWTAWNACGYPIAESGENP
jgi:hydroxyacylglutathione hydrolase